LSFDLERALRAVKPQRRRAPLVRRAERELPWVQDEAPIGVPLMLDTTVYIDVTSGRSPLDVDALITSRTCNHSTVALAELTHAFGRLDPAHPDTRVALRVVGETVRDIPSHRLHAPDRDVWGRAGMLAGAMLRLSGDKPPAAERRMLNDALLYLHAQKIGCALLTANIRDFDFLNQLIPEGRVILYRRHGASHPP
jgi:hypothetical protein